jgi:hypothetical protein
MPTQTRTSTGTATKVALGIAIGASAAFAAVSLNSSFMQQKMMGGKKTEYSSGPVKGAPGYQPDSADYCINKCFIAFSQCTDAGRGADVCGSAFSACRDLCSGSVPGYVPPAPGYIPPAPPVGEDVPGYIPPAMKPPMKDLPPGYMPPGGIPKEQPKK